MIYYIQSLEKYHKENHFFANFLYFHPRPNSRLMNIFNKSLLNEKFCRWKVESADGIYAIFANIEIAYMIYERSPSRMFYFTFCVPALCDISQPCSRPKHSFDSYHSYVIAHSLYSITVTCKKCASANFFVPITWTFFNATSRPKLHTHAAEIAVKCQQKKKHARSMDEPEEAAWRKKHDEFSCRACFLATERKNKNRSIDQRPPGQSNDEKDKWRCLSPLVFVFARVI